jgi:hypothetical protein
MARRRRAPSQGWKTFPRNHADGIASIDLFVVPAILFRLLGSKRHGLSPNAAQYRISQRQSYTNPEQEPTVPLPFYFGHFRIRRRHLPKDKVAGYSRGEGIGSFLERAVIFEDAAARGRAPAVGPGSVMRDCRDRTPFTGRRAASIKSMPIGLP